MPAAFHHEAQIVFAGEIYGGGDIARGLGSDCIDARRRHPGIGPARALRSPGLVADIERVAQITQQLLASRCVGIVSTGRERQFDLDEPPADRLD